MLPPGSQGEQRTAPECQEGADLAPKLTQMKERNDLSKRRFHQAFKVILCLSLCMAAADESFALIH